MSYTREIPMRTGTSTVVSCRLPDDVAAAFAAVATEHELSTSRLLRALVAQLLEQPDGTNRRGIAAVPGLTSSTSSAAAGAVVCVERAAA